MKVHGIPFFLFLTLLLLTGTTSRGAENPVRKDSGTTSPAPLSSESATSRERSKKDEDLPYKNLSVFMESLMILRSKYVDEEKITYENLLRAAMRGMLQELDPFSTYEEPEAFQNTVEDSMGKFPGIGVVITERDDALEIISVMEESPAAKAGLRSGDLILEIDGKHTRMMYLDECVKRMKGAVGTKVKLKVYRRSSDATKDVEIERAVIAVPSVKGAGLVSGRIGYLRITQFTATTASDLDHALSMLKKSPLHGLIIDLRNNPGGLLTAAIETVSRFIEKGRPVVSIEGRAEKKVSHNAVGCPKDLELPIAILINENSASAAAIFAACMQDYKRAILVGTRSFGKGSVQVIIPLSDGGALRITTAKYYTPGRREIHERGVDPDIAVHTSPAGTAAIARHFSERGDQVPLVRDGKYRDVQLERAIEILKGVHIFRQAEK